MVSGLLVALLLGVLQVALSAHVRTTLLDAAVEGARYEALLGAPPGSGAERTRALIAAGVGTEYAADVVSRRGRYLGVPSVEVSVRAPLPVLGLWGPLDGVEVAGHAPQELLG